MADTALEQAPPVERAPAPAPGRSGARRAGLAALAVLLVLAVAYLAVGAWRSTGADLDRVRSGRQALEYAGPTTALLARLGEARAAATAGQPADQQEIGSAAGAVEAVDARNGDALGVRATWTDLRRQLADGGGQSGAAAFPAGGDAVDRVVALMAAVRQGSGLAADPDPATRQLGEAVLVTLPDLVASAGRYAATLALPAGQPSTAGLRAAAADRVALAAAALDRSLRAGLDPGTDRAVTLGTVEEIRLAAADIAPAGPGAAPTRSAADVRSSVARLDDVAQRLADSTATGLRGRLADRAGDLTRQRATRAAVAVLVLILALGTLWARLPAGPARGPAEELAPVTRGPAEDTGAEEPSARLIDARALLREVEVVRVGRAVRSVPRQHRDADAAEPEDERA